MSPLPASSSTLLGVWQRTYAPGWPSTPARALAVPHNRAMADANAAWLRWHRPEISRTFNAAQLPWYILFDRARVETLASRHLPGMGQNLSALETLAPNALLPGSVYRYARTVLATGAPAEADANLCIPMPAAPRWHKLYSWMRQRPSHPASQSALPLLMQSRACLEDAELYADTLRPLISRLAQALPIPELVADGVGQSKTQQAESDGPTQMSRTSGAADAEHDYRAFSRAWDEVLDARILAMRLGHSLLDAIKPEQRTQAQALARRLQRRLLAREVRPWRDEQAEGVLDRKRLPSIIATGDHMVFRRADTALVPQACVTLLLDQSGSMRGLPRALTLQAIDLAVHVLEACHVRCEVLGYGTRFGADNPLSRDWHAQGCPRHPGRLNALRHVIYKPAGQAWRRCRQLLIRQPDTENENIDGEALEWAAARLARQPEARKILVVFSDASPYDEATARANGRRYLEDHLHHAIAKVDASRIHLAAIGVGHALGRYYRHALTLRSAAKVSEVLFEHLADLLTRPAYSRKKSR